MLPFEIITKDEAATKQSIINPFPGGRELATFYKETLEKAAKDQLNLLSFSSIPFTEKNSDNFQNIYFLEETIVSFLRSHAYPKKVQIVCDKASQAELYKVVYNFYYPSTKAERLEHEGWD